MTCIVELILCLYTSGYIVDMGTEMVEYVKGPVCVEEIVTKAVKCKVINEDATQYQVDCTEGQKEFDLAKNKLNDNPKWVNKNLCSENI